jgi:hypothetical protein
MQGTCLPDVLPPNASFGFVGLGNVTGCWPVPVLLTMAFHNLVANVIGHARSYSRSPDCCTTKIIVSLFMNRYNLIG